MRRRIFSTKRLEDYLSETEVEIIKTFKDRDNNQTLKDLWEQFISTALLIYGEDLSKPITREIVIKEILELK